MYKRFTNSNNNMSRRSPTKQDKFREAQKDIHTKRGESNKSPNRPMRGRSPNREYQIMNRSRSPRSNVMIRGKNDATRAKSPTRGKKEDSSVSYPNRLNYNKATPMVRHKSPNRSPTRTGNAQPYCGCGLNSVGRPTREVREKLYEENINQRPLGTRRNYDVTDEDDEYDEEYALQYDNWRGDDPVQFCSN